GGVVRGLDLRQEPAQRRRQRRDARSVGAEHRATADPHVQIDAPIAQPRDEFDRAIAREKQRREHAAPEQQHHGKPQHLTEREQAIFERPEQAHTRFHREYMPPRATAPAAIATVQRGIPAPVDMVSVTFNIAAERQPSTIVGVIAAARPSASVMRSASSRTIAGANAGREAARYAAARDGAPAITRATGAGTPTSPSDDAQRAATHPAISAATSAPRSNTSRAAQVSAMSVAAT